MADKGDKILYVLVIYRCTIEQSLSYRTLIAPEEGAVEHLFVYDNSPYRQESDKQVACYVSDTSNGGLGKAYNAACRFAEKHGYKWLLLMDQDTAFPPKALKAYRQAADTIATNMIVPRHRVESGLYLSPTRYSMKTSKLQKEALTGMVLFKDAGPINSGMMVSVEAFKKAGGYDEAVWLDLSDIRFIEKFRKHFNSFYVMPDVVCQQTFSALETDMEKVFSRFLIYLECASNFPKDSVLDAIALTITTLRPTLSYTLRRGSMRFLKAYWRVYILKKDHKWRNHD